MQKTIAFDLDSTLADSTKIWCELYNLTFTQNISENDLYHEAERPTDTIGEDRSDGNGRLT